jgi:hypothetical protein
LKLDPKQLPEVGVIIYVAVMDELVVFVSVPLIVFKLFPDKAPVIPGILGADQLYVVLVGTRFPDPFVGVIEKEFEEQIG